MADGLSPRPPERARGRPFDKGRLGNPAGRRTGCRNRATIAVAALLAGEAATTAAVVDTFVRAIETSGFDRRLQLAEAELPTRRRAVAGRAAAEPGGHFNRWARFCC